MALVSEYLLACESLPLVAVASRVPDADLSLSIGQPNQGGPPPFFVRATGESFDALEAALDGAAFVGEWTLLNGTEQTRQYQVIPSAGMVEQLADVVDDPDRLRALSANASVVKDVRATPDGWVQERWFADRAAFEEYRDFWTDNGVRISVRRLYRPDAEPGGTDLLTGPQREALVAAHEMGYFEVPRTASLAEVADRLDVSAPALSERLRRAQARLVEEYLSTEGGPNRVVF